MSSLMYRTANENQQYGGFTIRGQQKSQDRTQPNIGQGQSNGRPNSAGATRGRSGSFGFARNNSSNSGNLYAGGAPGLTGQGYVPPQQTQQRPSSAGHSRPPGGAINNPTLGAQGLGNITISHLIGTHQQPQPQTTTLQYGQLPSGANPILVAANVNLTPGTAIGLAQGNSHARPKSAGAVRRSGDVQPATTQMTLNNIYGTQSGSTAAAIATQQHLFFQQQQMLAAQQQQRQQAQLNTYPAMIHQQQQSPYDPTTVVAALQHQQHPGMMQQQQGMGAGLGGGPQVQPAPAYQFANPLNASKPASSVRPLSANATAHTSSHHAHNANAYGDQWNSSYKMHYGYGGASAASGYDSKITSAGAGDATVTTVVSGENQRPASATANKLRSAVDMSHKYDGTGGVSHGATMAQLAGVDNEDDLAADLDGMVLGTEDAGVPVDDRMDGKGGLRDDDDEMDGKPMTVGDSRTHPEVSMTTLSASLEIGGGGSAAQALDARNTSLDSFSEEHIQLGVSTLPNQFCSARDALELKKLLLLSVGTRGGIVPSSSAVMDMYMVGKVVGVGSYGKVRAAWHRITGSKVAIKTYDKSKLKDPSHWKRVHSEIKIMEQLSHPRIARMYEAVETPKRMHLIMECLDGGNLCSYVKAKRRLSEDESRRIFFQIVQAMEYLHALGVAHRDIKLENVLFTNDGKDIKLIDFGFSTVCQPGKKQKVFCGTPSYMAPEIVRRLEYEGKPVDMWSMGILLYALLCGCFPFRAKAYPDLYRRIARGTFPIPDELSAPVKDLLRQLLTVDADQRITAHAALRHPWLQVQLLNAPNIDKMRLEDPVLISDKPADDLDEQVIGELEKFGMAKDEMIRLVLTKTHSSLATLYYLLLEVLVGKRRQAVKRANALGISSTGVTTGPNLSKQRPNTVGVMKAKNITETIQQQMLMQQQQQQQQAAAAAQYAPQHVHAQQQMMSGPPTGAVPPGVNMAQHTAAGGTPTSEIDPEQAYLMAQQQQGGGDRAEYRLRPKSASMNNRSGGPGQRPLSAYAGRR